jgi:hypothetical protein
MISADAVWHRIARTQGATFQQKLGKPFKYSVSDRTIHLSTTSWHISRTAIEKALTLVPLDGPSTVNHLPAPSYVYGILMDTRIRGSDW